MSSISERPSTATTTTGKHPREMDDRGRAASWKTATDRNLHHERAEEIRVQWLAWLADGIGPDTDVSDLKRVLAMTAEIKDAQRPPRPRGPFFRDK